MKSNNNNNSTTQQLDHLTRSAHGKFMILLAFTALFVFLPLVSESYGSGIENKYHGFYVVSSYKNFDDAEALMERLRAQGYDPFGKTVNIPDKGKYRRVYVKRYGNKKEALSEGKKLREKGMFKGFFILFVKTGPEDNKAVPKRNSDKEDNKNIPPPPVLTKTEIPVAPAVPPLAKKEIPVAPTVPPLAKKEIPVAPAVPPLTKVKIVPPNTEKMMPSHKAQIDKPDPGLKMGKKSYISAMSDFTAGRYKDALGKFKKIIKTEKNEAVMRRIADCYYFLGDKGDKRYLLEGIDQYRNIIRNYPGSKKENAKAVFRLAQGLCRLKFYSNALMEFKNLCSRYPESVYFSESLYMMGKMNYKTGNLNGAITDFKKYIKRFPDGKHVRKAYFSVGDCYSQMHKFNDADVWYGNALKRWPALEDIPKDSFLNLGSYYFQTGKNREALRAFFVYLNLFPDGKDCKNALYTIARSFERMGQLPLALKALSQVVERYPGSSEALKSAFIMANIGVKDPEIKLPVYIFPGFEYYRNPIEAYDKIREKLSDLDRQEELVFREELVFQKGCALLKKKRYREAFDNCRFFLDKFSYGTHETAGEENLILSAGGLIDDYYSKKDYLAVSDVYFNFDGNILFKNGNFDMLLKIGTSLNKIGLPDNAAGLFEEMIKVFAEDKRINELLLDMAKIDYDRSRYEDARKRLKGLLGKRSDLDKKTAMTAKKLLGDICYKERLFKDAVGFYMEVTGAKEGVEDSAAIRKKYADSLRGMGLYSSARINYKRVLKNCGDPAQKCSASVIMGSYEGLGDCLYSEGKYQQAITMYEKSLEGVSEGKQNMWAIFNIGRGYANLGNKPMADKSFSSLKKETSNEFWSRVMDYYTSYKNRTTGLEI
ncbi:MAG: hypothetical protein DRH26_00230 [Deltaproteobacteria bacterium]|nr:MAG: hypothetical protein DRH26_00230 [Deltaproteobacteria bacterium]